jgi:cation-transporting ATPase E
VLGFLPNASAYRPGFLRRTVRFCVPSGLIVAASVLAVVLIALRAGVPPAQVQTAAVITLTLSALWVLAILARPFTRLTAALVGGSYLGLLLVLSVPLSRTFLVLELPPADVTAAALVASCAASVLLELVHRLGRTGSPLRTA